MSKPFTISELVLKAVELVNSQSVEDWSIAGGNSINPDELNVGVVIGEGSRRGSIAVYSQTKTDPGFKPSTATGKP